MASLAWHQTATPRSGGASRSSSLLALLTVLALPAAGHAQARLPVECASASVTMAEVPHTMGTVKIDGVLDDDVWCEALVLSLDVETSPGENTPAPVETHAFLIEDGSRLLVAFDARDPHPEQIRAYLRDRDAAYNDDFVGVVLDTFNDERRAFEFFVNALGVQMDMTFDDVSRKESDAWDGIWESAGQINDRGYAVELAIPFSQLPFPNGDGEQTWGIDLLRFYPRQDRERLSIHPLERGRNCYLCQATKVSGFSEAEPGRGLEIVPTLTASRTDSRDDPAVDPLVAGPSDAEFGLNVRWGITPDLTANLAINPDFSQVEADVPQLDVNNQFTLFYPEKRPFFLDGADYFATPINAVFTRTVADPDLGAKLTGKSGENTFGIFAAEDTLTNLLFPGPLRSETESLEQSNRAIVARYSRGFGDSSTIGLLMTSRSGNDYHNDLGGIDGRYRMNDRNSLRFQLLHSATAYPDEIVTDFEQPEDDFSGDATRLQYDYESREWFANLVYERIGPGFRADTGFVSRVDVEQRNATFGHVWHGDEDNWWNQIRVAATSSSTYDRSGRLLGRGPEASIALQGPLQSYVQVGLFDGSQFYDGILFDQGGMWMYGQIRPVGGLQFSMSANRREQIDFDNTRLGDQIRIQPRIDWNANRHLSLRLQHTYQTLDSKQGPNIFNANLTDLRLTWQFNIRSFLRLTVQRQDIERNLDLYVDEDTDGRSTTMGSQLLFSYKLNPQTLLYLGYSDNHLRDDDVLELTRTDRTFFAKFSYAWLP